MSLYNLRNSCFQFCTVGFGISLPEGQYPLARQPFITGQLSVKGPVFWMVHYRSVVCLMCCFLDEFTTGRLSFKCAVFWMDSLQVSCLFNVLSFGWIHYMSVVFQMCCLLDGFTTGQLSVKFAFFWMNSLQVSCLLNVAAF